MGVLPSGRTSSIIFHLQPGPAAPNAAVKQTKGSHGRQVMKVRTPGGRGGAEAQKASPVQQGKFSGSASDQMAAAMKLLSETVSQAMMGGVTTGQAGQAQQAKGVRNQTSFKLSFVFNEIVSRDREVPRL